MNLKIKNKITAFFQGDQRTVTVKKNAIASVLLKGVSIIVSLLLVPMTLDYLSGELYGIWLTLSSMVVWLNFFDIGFTMGLKNKLAEAIANEKWSRGKSLVSTSYVMMLGIFIPLCVIGEIIIPYIDWCGLLNVSHQYDKEIIITVQILLVCFCTQMVTNTLTSVLAAFQKVAFSSVFGVIGQVISLIVIFVLTKTTQPSLVLLSICLSIIPIAVTGIASLVLFRGELKKVAPSIKDFKKDMINDLFSLGYKFFIIQIQAVILYQTTNVLISNVSGPIEVAAYNIAYKYLGVAIMIFQLLLNPLWPAFTDAFTKKDYSWMTRIYNKLSRGYVGCALVILAMILCAPIVYKIWIGDKIDIPMIMTISIGIYVIVHCWDMLQVMLISGIGTIKLETRVILIGLIGYLPLALFLGREFGAIGVVSAMTIINIIYCTIFTIQCRKIINQTATGIWIQ